MKKIILLFVILSTSPVALAHFMSEYPEILIEDDKIDAIIVVGEKAPSSHVLAQAQIALSLSALVAERPEGIAKLDSEVESIENKNIISIGNACINKVTAEILDDPEPCDLGIEPGKATIQIFEGSNEEAYIVVNAFSDKGIRKAADVLASYKNYKMDGDLILVDVDEDIKKEIDAKSVIEEEKEGQKQEEPAQENKIEAEETAEIPGGESGNQGIVQVEEKSIIKKIVSWFKSLFKK